MNHSGQISHSKRPSGHAILVWTPHKLGPLVCKIRRSTRLENGLSQRPVKACPDQSLGADGSLSRTATAGRLGQAKGKGRLHIDIEQGSVSLLHKGVSTRFLTSIFTRSSFWLRQPPAPSASCRMG